VPLREGTSRKYLTRAKRKCDATSREREPKKNEVERTQGDQGGERPGAGKIYFSFISAKNNFGPGEKEKKGKVWEA